MRFANTRQLREEGLKFEQNGYYCDSPKGTKGFYDYWEEQERRCKEGYSVGDLEITGYHYFYLNFGRIERVFEDPDTGDVSERMAPPLFYDWDYNYFWALDIAKNGISPEKYEKLNLDINIKDLTGGNHMVVLKSRRKGYAQPNSHLVETPNGQRKIGDLEVGDSVLGADGKETQVTEVHPQGKEEVVEVTLRDGRTAKCSKDHLWNVIDYKGNERTVSTEYMMNNTDLIHNKGKDNQYYHWYIRNCKPIKYEEKNLPIDPYVLGVFLGDGGGKRSSLKISSSDEEVINEVRNRLPSKYSVSSRSEDCIHYSITTPNQHKNPLIRKLKKLDQWTGCLNKYIPSEYLMSSIEQRKSLLRGLMDTDGTSSPGGTAEFTTSSEDLKDSIVRLLAGLGIRYKVSDAIDPYESSFSKNKHWSISITTEEKIFNLTRKQENIRNDREYDYNKIPIVNIEPLGYEEKQTCITVNNEDSLYLSENYVVTHNSYKSASMLARNFCLGENSKNYAMVSDSEYLTGDGLFSKTWDQLAFMEENTPFGQPKLKDQKLKKVAGYKEKKRGIEVEKGKKNAIIGVSLKDNPEKAVGKSGELGFFEEAGKFPGLIEAWEACRPSYEQGKYTTGTMIAYGTGGTEGADYEGLEELFFNPENYNVLPIENQWDTGTESNTCGFFVPAYVNYEGFIKDNGVSQKDAAREYLEQEREKKQEGDDPRGYNKHVAQFPFTPREATMRVDNNILPTSELNAQLSKVISKGLHNSLTAGRLSRTGEDGEIEFNLDESVNPIFKFPTPKDTDRRGGVVIKQSPYEGENGKVPNNMYFICHDPYAHDGSPEGSSLGAAYVIKRKNPIDLSYANCPVASYVGRPARQDDYNRNLFMLAEYYNAKIAFENNRGNVMEYAKNNNLLQYLHEKPDIQESRQRTRSRTTRKYGMGMNSKSDKNQAEVYIRDWLLEEYAKSPDGERKLVLNKILDPALLKELANYNKDGNFDRVSALMIGMYYLKQLESKAVKEQDPIEQHGDFFNRNWFPK